MAPEILPHLEFLTPTINLEKKFLRHWCIWSKCLNLAKMAKGCQENLEVNLWTLNVLTHLDQGHQLRLPKSQVEPFFKSYAYFGKACHYCG